MLKEGRENNFSCPFFCLVFIVILGSLLNFFHVSQILFWLFQAFVYFCN